MNDLELTAYKYDPNTKIYRGKVICQIDPVATKKSGCITYIMPGNSTDKVPPEPKAGYDIVWVDGAWVLREIPAEPEPPEPTVEEKQEQVRAVRNGLLDDSDKYLMPDFPIDDAGRELYIQYRQYLRDYTQSPDWWESEPLNFEDWVLQSEK